ncbi:hypothetical protein L2E82_21822 [Cichorium intybus]|uniref:Uncharacterized protein n=1 Tax=Cichorium intybus TaxID=13427 RepID=A0ACB9DW01_CICIN|nr:hypothetical protein L2E82_21822 [Cichorium intybus]
MITTMGMAMAITITIQVITIESFGSVSASGLICRRLRLPMIDEYRLLCSFHITKKNPCKVPKRIHMAEREKMKREHLNELFLELAAALVDYENKLRTTVTWKVIYKRVSLMGNPEKGAAEVLNQSFLKLLGICRNDVAEGWTAIKPMVDLFGKHSFVVISHLFLF